MKKTTQQEIEQLIEKRQAKNINIIQQEQLTFGQRASDFIATKAGS